MGKLHDRMQEDLLLKAYSPHTQRAYLGCARHFARHYLRSPEEMGEQKIRDFLLHLARDRKASPATLSMYVNALKFLYNVNLQRPEEVKGISHPKRPKTLPVILSPEEVLRILAAIRSVKHKAIIATAYAAGLRISEVCGLRLADIDSQRMRIHVRAGKGKKDRYVMLGESLLALLRQYYQAVRPPGEYLFPGTKTSATHLHHGSNHGSAPGFAESHPGDWFGEESHHAHLAPLFCHPSAGGRHRHPHPAGPPGPQLHPHHPALHPHHRPIGPEAGEPPGFNPACLVTAGPMTRPALEVAQIFCRHGPEYRQNHGLTPAQHQAMRDIERCRTTRLGGHLDVCSQGCGYLAISYNSCRNRHCPKCQSLTQAKWLAGSTPNPSSISSLRAPPSPPGVCPGLRTPAGPGRLHGRPAHLGSGPQLSPPSAPGGHGRGAHPDGSTWVAASNSFLLPVRALSKIIRGKFLEALEKAWHAGKLQGWVPPAQFPRFLRKLRRKKWVVYAKEALGGSQKAYQYLSRYTHRVAIANQRLVSLAAGQVTFQARDNHRPGHKRLVTLTAPEFIRRFLWHVLPPRFAKIRHYGLMAPRHAKTKLEKARTLLSLQAPEALAEPKNRELDTPNGTNTWQDMLRALTGLDLTVCPSCGARLIRTKLTGNEDALAPPIWNSS